MEKTNSILQKIGLTKEEVLIYKALLSVGSASISDLVRKTKIHRPAVYRALPNLIDLGLISIMPKGKNKLYIAESPDRLDRIFKNLEDDFDAEIYNMKEVFETRDKKPKILFSEGDRAIKDLFSDVVHSLKKNDVYYRYSPALTVDKKKYVPADYRIVRDRKSLERLIITDENSKNKMTARLGKSVRTVPDKYKLFESKVSEIIYGSKVAFVDYNSKTVVVIENQMISDFQKNIFKLLYEKL